jgi:hypothetical protein
MRAIPLLIERVRDFLQREKFLPFDGKSLADLERVGLETERWESRSQRANEAKLSCSTAISSGENTLKHSLKAKSQRINAR